MAKYVYECIDKYVDDSNTFDELLNYIMNDETAILEIEDVEFRKNVGDENIKIEVENVVISYEELRMKFGI